jgi:hypothetical protein
MLGYGKKADTRDDGDQVQNKIYLTLHQILVASLNCWNSEPIL